MLLFLHSKVGFENVFKDVKHSSFNVLQDTVIVKDEENERSEKMKTFINVREEQRVLGVSSVVIIDVNL